MIIYAYFLLFCFVVVVVAVLVWWGSEGRICTFPFSVIIHGRPVSVSFTDWLFICAVFYWQWPSINLPSIKDWLVTTWAGIINSLQSCAHRFIDWCQSVKLVSWADSDVAMLCDSQKTSEMLGDTLDSLSDYLALFGDVRDLDGTGKWIVMLASSAGECCTGAALIVRDDRDPKIMDSLTKLQRIPICPDDGLRLKFYDVA